MLLNREPYRTTFKIFTFLGFWDEIPVRHKRLTLHIPLALFFIYAFTIGLSFLQADELKDALVALEILHLVLVILFSIFDMLMKKVKVKKLLQIVDKIELENPEVSCFIDSACWINCVVYLLVFFFTVATFLFYAFTPLVTGKLAFPVYMPEIVKDEPSVFYLFWVMQVIIGSYSGFSNFMLYEFRNGLMVLLWKIVECYQEKLRKLKCTKVELQKCVEFHLRIKE
jgi:hypothetical protein